MKKKLCYLYSLSKRREYALSDENRLIGSKVIVILHTHTYTHTHARVKIFCSKTTNFNTEKLKTCFSTFFVSKIFSLLQSFLFEDFFKRRFFKRNWKEIIRLKKNSNVAEAANFRAYFLQTNQNESTKASQHLAITFLRGENNWK